MKTGKTFPNPLDFCTQWVYNIITVKDIVNSGRDYLDCSYDLCNRRDCDYDEDAEQLNGTCAIGVNSMWDDDEELVKKYNMAKGYSNNHHNTNTVYLIADERMEGGEDENEVILGSANIFGDTYGANVVAIVEL